MILLFLFLTAESGLAYRIDSLSETLHLDYSGKASVRWKLDLGSISSNELLLPWNFPHHPDTLLRFMTTRSGEELSGELPSMSLIERDGIWYLRTWLPDTLPTSLTIQFEIPDFYDFQGIKKSDFGNYSFKKRFINTSVAEIRCFSSEIVFPGGFDITMINETIPKQGADDPVSPYRISRRNDRNSVIMKTEGLKLGEDVFISLQIKSSHKSPYLLIGMILAGMLYLVYFRDLVQFKKVNPVGKKY